MSSSARSQVRSRERGLDRPRPGRAAPARAQGAHRTARPRTAAASSGGIRDDVSAAQPRSARAPARSEPRTRAGPRPRVSSRGPTTTSERREPRRLVPAVEGGPQATTKAQRADPGERLSGRRRRRAPRAPRQRRPSAAPSSAKTAPLRGAPPQRVLWNTITDPARKPVQSASTNRPPVAPPTATVETSTPDVAASPTKNGPPQEASQRSSRQEQVTSPTCHEAGADPRTSRSPIRSPTQTPRSSSITRRERSWLRPRARCDTAMGRGRRVAESVTVLCPGSPPPATTG